MYVIFRPSASPSPVANIHCVGTYPGDNERPSALRTPPLPSNPHPIIALLSNRFAPFQDTLTLDHSSKLSSILMPGSEDYNFHSAKSDLFENESHGGNVDSERLKRDMIALELVEPSSPNQVDNCGGYGGRERERGSYRLQGWR